MRAFLAVVVFALVTGCTPYTAAELAAVEAQNPSQKFMGYGEVCGSTGRGIVCNYSGR